MTIEEIWESSCNNQYSWYLPLVLVVGFIIILSTSIIKNGVLRRFLKIFLFLLLCVMAIGASFIEIDEKWRIRHEWVQNNSQDSVRQFNNEGANMLFGPFEFGGKYAFWTFGSALILSSVWVRMNRKTPLSNPQGITRENDTGEQ